MRGLRRPKNMCRCQICCLDIRAWCRCVASKASLVGGWVGGWIGDLGVLGGPQGECNNIAQHCIMSHGGMTPWSASYIGALGAAPSAWQDAALGRCVGSEFGFPRHRLLHTCFRCPTYGLWRNHLFATVLACSSCDFGADRTEAGSFIQPSPRPWSNDPAKK